MRTGAIVTAPLAAVALAVFGDGGYSSGVRLAFGVAAVVGLAVVVAADGRSAVREPAVLVLLALAGVGALSALWTIGPADRTLEWALVTAGYGAIALAGTAAVRRAGPEILAGGVAALAVAAAATGLIAAVAFQAPYAERVAGVWRPGGPFEYAPALALLQVSALPALIGGMVHRSRVLAGASAVGMALAGGALALSGSRTGVAMGVAVAGGALVVSARRQLVAKAIALAVTAGTFLQIALGGPVATGAPVDRVRVAALAAVVLLAAPVWLLGRRAFDRRMWAPGSRRPRPVALSLVALAALLAGALAFGPAAGRGSGPESGFLHGRADTWQAAVLTFADKPLTGAGADAFLAGSAQHQGGQTVLFAHDLPLELAAELGVAGLILALLLYAACLRAVWRARTAPAARLLGPAVLAFLAASLVDWPWHLAGSGAVWALALGAVAGSSAPRANRSVPPYPRRQMKIVRTSAALAVAAIAFAGCGGGNDSNKTLSYSEFGPKAGEVCTTANAGIKPISSKLNGDPANDAPLLGQLIPKLKDANDKMKALKAPDELKADFDKFNSITDEQIGVTEKAKSLAESGDQAGYQAQVQQLQSLGSESDVQASKLGAKACISD